MPHQAATSLLSWLPAQSAPAAKALVLTAPQVSVLTSALNTDAADIHYSAVVSFLDALNGIKGAYFSWSTVKLYYSCFYCVRSILASNGIGIVYVPVSQTGSSPFSILSRVNESPRLEKGVTHKIVWSVFEREFSQNPLLGDIGLERAYKWMTSLRESVNYKNPRFQDPVVPTHFYEADKQGIDKIINAYFADNAFSFAFDEAHASLAFPIECIKRSRASLQGAGISFDQADREYIDACKSNLSISEDLVSKLVC